MRDRLRQVVIDALEAVEAVDTAWEGGSAAFGRADDASDIDVNALVADGSADVVFDAVHATLDDAFGVVVRYRIPEPTWHGHSQTFWKLAGVPPTLLVDVVLMARSTEPAMLFLEPERHGRARLVVDHRGEGVPTPPPFDEAAVRAQLRAALADAIDRFELFAGFAPKEQHRGREIDWLASWHAHVLRPLVTVLGIRWRPLRHDFGMRYLHDDLPPDVADRLLALLQPTATDDAEALLATARTLFDETAAGIDVDAMPLAELAVAARA